MFYDFNIYKTAIYCYIKKPGNYLEGFIYVEFNYPYVLQEMAMKTTFDTQYTF